MYIVDQSPPDHRLLPFVRGYIQRQTPSPSAPISVEPYVARLGGMLDFLFASPYKISIQGTSQHVPCFASAIVGPHTDGRIQLFICGRIEEFVIRLHSQGFHHLFGQPTHFLVNRGLEASAVLGPSMRQLYEQLGNATSFRQRAQLSDAFLLEQINNAKTPDRLSKVFDAIIASAGVLSVGESARQAGLSVRQFERKCLEYTGLNPKTLTRISRFERALALKRAGGVRWTTIAHQLEYFDQMHLIRDFRALAGDTPTHVMRQISSHHLISMP